MNSNPEVNITSFYKFIYLDSAKLTRVQSCFESFAAESGLRGLMILADEGCNTTVSGTSSAISKFKELAALEFGVPLEFKDSTAPTHPFSKFSVKLRSEIVTSGLEGNLESIVELAKGGINMPPAASGNPSVSEVTEFRDSHLTPMQWEEMLTSGIPHALLDTRNSYETAIGKFKGAIDPSVENFTEFVDALPKLGLSKEEPLLIYCTGGVRCEKIAPHLLALGFKEVYQLRGGILKYLEERPNRLYEGECFVFDDRVAVDQELRPTSTYAFCPHCGTPAAELCQCPECGSSAKICSGCKSQGRITCSKNCANRICAAN